MSQCALHAHVFPEFGGTCNSLKVVRYSASKWLTFLDYHTGDTTAQWCTHPTHPTQHTAADISCNAEEFHQDERRARDRLCCSDFHPTWPATVRDNITSAKRYPLQLMKLLEREAGQRVGVRQLQNESCRHNGSWMANRPCRIMV